MIYMVGDVDKQFCKIGYTEKLSSRLATFNNACPLHIKLFAIWDGKRRDERRFHQKMKHLHHKLEWFIWSDDFFNFGDSFLKRLPLDEIYPEKKRHNRFEEKLFISGRSDYDLADITTVDIWKIRNLRKHKQTPLSLTDIACLKDYISGRIIKKAPAQ